MTATGVHIHEAFTRNDEVRLVQAGRSKSVEDELVELVHDLRSPLAAIEAAAHAVMGMGVNSPEAERLIDLVAHEARAAHEVVDAALHGTHEQSGFAVAPVLARVAAQVSTHWAVRVTLGGSGIGECAQGERADISRAVANLIDNAIQHGGCREVALHVDRRGDWLVLRIAGTGLTAARPTQVSHGLGLRSVRRLAQASGGHHEVAYDGDQRVDELHLRAADAPRWA